MNFLIEETHEAKAGRSFPVRQLTRAENNEELSAVAKMQNNKKNAPNNSPPN